MILDNSVQGKVMLCGTRVDEGICLTERTVLCSRLEGLADWWLALSPLPCPAVCSWTPETPW